MIPSDIAARLRTLVDASLFDTDQPVQSVARTREIQAQLSELLPGQRFEATILRHLPSGAYLAAVAGREYTLALNTDAQVGDTLNLVVTQNKAHTIFAQPAANPAATQTSSASAVLSQTGRLISFLLTGQPAPQPALLTAGKPMLTAPPAPGSASLFAPILRQALAQSGLFYESHQTQWLSGKLDLAALKMEPQGQIQTQAQNARNPAQAGSTGMAGAQPGAAGNAQTAQGALAQAAAALRGDQPIQELAQAVKTLMYQATADETQEVSQQPSPQRNPAGASQDTGSNTGQTARQQSDSHAGSPLRAIPGAASGQNTAQATTAHAEENTGAQMQAQAQNAAARPATMIPERLMPIVHQQLEALGTQTYIWQGLAWPGQPIEWEIEDGDADNGGGDSNENSWNSTLRLTLPRLGGVEAQLRLTAEGVAFRLQADDPETVAAMQEAHAALARALEAANVPLTGFVVTARESDSNG